MIPIVGLGTHADLRLQLCDSGQKLVRELASEEKPADSVSHTIMLPCETMKKDTLWQANTVYPYPIDYL